MSTRPRIQIGDDALGEFGVSVEGVCGNKVQSDTGGPQVPEIDQVPKVLAVAEEQARVPWELVMADQSI